MPTVTMSEADLDQASREGVWYPLCPHCATETPAEPDAEVVYCTSCDALIEIEKSFS